MTKRQTRYHVYCGNETYPQAVESFAGLLEAKALAMGLLILHGRSPYYWVEAGNRESYRAGDGEVVYRLRNDRLFDTPVLAAKGK